MKIIRFFIVFSVLFGFFIAAADASSFTVHNATKVGFSSVRVTGAFSSVPSQIAPESNGVFQLEGLSKFVIRLATADGRVQSIVYFPYNTPALRCLPGDFICSNLSLSGVTLH